MKKFVSIILATLVLVTTACGVNIQPGGRTPGNAASSPSSEVSSTASTSTSVSDPSTDTTTAASSALSSTDSTDAKITTKDGQYWSEPNVFPIVEEPVTYNIMAAYFPSSAPHEEIQMWKEYEGITNVKINWESVAYNDQYSKLALSLSSGVYPDAYFNFYISTAQLIINGQQGILIPLQDLIAEQGPNITNVYNNFPVIKKNSIAPDGNIYSLFQYDPGLHMSTNQKMFINQQWLLDSGLNMPTTIEEFADVLRYFKNNDMNGNGDNSDEIPLAGYIGTDPSVFLINPFILKVNRDLLIVNDIVTPIFNTEEYRNALRYVHGLYAEGLIGSETYTMDSSAFSALVNRPDEMIVGAVGTQMLQSFWLNVDMFKDGYGAHTYIPVPPLIGPLGKGQTPYTDDGVLISRSIQITKDCVDPVILIKWIDYFYDEMHSFWQLQGYEGINWEWVDEESLSGEKPVYRLIQDIDLLSSGALENRIIQNQGPMFQTTNLLYRQAKVPGSNWFAWYEDSVMYQKYQDKNQKYLPFTVWMDEETARVNSQLEQMINNYVGESRARFIVGELDLDTDWDSYVNEINLMDLKTYVAIWQKIYNDSIK